MSWNTVLWNVTSCKLCQYLCVLTVKPLFKTPPLSHKDVVRAQTAVIHCDVMGKPVPEVDWSKDGSILKETGLIGFQSNKHILVIRQLKTEDSGLYKCEARNIVGKVTADINIKVFGKFLRALILRN